MNDIRIEVSVDTELAACYNETYSISSQIETAAARIHSYNNTPKKRVPKSRGRGYYDVYEYGVQQAIEELQTKIVNTDDYYIRNYGPKSIQTYQTLIQQQNEIYAVQRELNEIFNEWGGWSRFFMVLGGHIHSSMECHSCYETTRFSWLPTLSGLTEAEAVAEHGTILCTHCYPSAPVEWTVSKQGEKPADFYCDGSGKSPAETDKGYRRYQPCSVCGSIESVTTYGYIRKHKKPAA